MNRTVSAGGVVLNSQGQVLVVNQRGLAWSLPKGHIDPGEDALTAARREIHEEAGISELDLVQSLGSYERYKMNKEGGDDLSELKVLHFFLFKTKQTKLQPLDADHPEARWVDPQKVAGLLTHARDKEFFLSILSKIANLKFEI